MKNSFIILISILLPSLLSGNLAAQELDAFRSFDTMHPEDYRLPAFEIQPATNAATAQLNSFVDTEYTAYYSIGTAQTYLQWGDYSDTANDQRLSYMHNVLSRLHSEHNFNALDDEGKLTYLVFEAFAENQIRLMENSGFSYPITHRGGVHQTLITYLKDYYTINQDGDTQVYLSCVNDISRVFDETIAAMRSRAEDGVILPSFLITLIIDNCREIISGYPFAGDGVCPVMEDFQRKVNAAPGMSSGQRTTRIAELRNALLNSMGPAYQRLIDYLEDELLPLADDTAGVWKFPNGDDHYEDMLKFYTTTSLSPQKIHKRGQRNVRRIHREMETIMEQVKFKKGGLSEFFKYMRTKNKFYLPNTADGRQKFLDRVEEIIANMQGSLNLMFVNIPTTPLEVRAVESYREKTAGIAFYTRPSTDLTRPGIYYINTYDLRNIPLFELESLSHHEGIPGHHFQIALTMERNFGAGFRSRASFTGYIEGWALYAESIPKEFGFYQDPYSDFGRLSEELWRACRLVVDTGLHYKKWTRDEAIQYLLDNTPSSYDACRDAIDRYIVMPGQACAYLLGKQVIDSLRTKAEKKLGDGFDLREFHEAILENGALPLPLLEDVINDWVDEASEEDELNEAA